MKSKEPAVSLFFAVDSRLGFPVWFLYDGMLFSVSERAKELSWPCNK